jgi:hypothetical protein
MDETKSPETYEPGDALEMKDLHYDDQQVIPTQDVESAQGSTLKKSVERKWMAAIYGLMFLAGGPRFLYSPESS